MSRAPRYSAGKDTPGSFRLSPRRSIDRTAALATSAFGLVANDLRIYLNTFPASYPGVSGTSSRKGVVTPIAEFQKSEVKKNDEVRQPR